MATFRDDRPAADAFVRSRLTGKFINPQSEVAYREWHCLKSHSILSAMSLTLGVLFTAGAAVAIRNEDSLKGHALNALFSTTYKRFLVRLSLPSTHKPSARQAPVTRGFLPQSTEVNAVYSC